MCRQGSFCGMSAPKFASDPCRIQTWQQTLEILDWPQSAAEEVFYSATWSWRCASPIWLDWSLEAFLGKPWAALKTVEDSTHCSTHVVISLGVLKALDAPRKVGQHRRVLQMVARCRKLHCPPGFELPRRAWEVSSGMVSTTSLRFCFQLIHGWELKRGSKF